MKKKVEKKRKRKNNEAEVSNAQSNLQRFLNFLKEEKGFEKFDAKFFDNDRKELLKEYFDSIHSSNLSKSSQCAHTSTLKNFFLYCSTEYAPICENQLRKGNANELEAAAGMELTEQSKKISKQKKKSLKNSPKKASTEKAPTRKSTRLASSSKRNYFEVRFFFTVFWGNALTNIKIISITG